MGNAYKDGRRQYADLAQLRQWKNSGVRVFLHGTPDESVARNADLVATGASNRVNAATMDGYVHFSQGWYYLDYGGFIVIAFERDLGHRLYKQGGDITYVAQGPVTVAETPWWTERELIYQLRTLT